MLVFVLALVLALVLVLVLVRMLVLVLLPRPTVATADPSSMLADSLLSALMIVCQQARP